MQIMSKADIGPIIAGLSRPLNLKRAKDGMINMGRRYARETQMLVSLL